MLRPSPASKMFLHHWQAARHPPEGYRSHNTTSCMSYSVRLITESMAILLCITIFTAHEIGKVAVDGVGHRNTCDAECQNRQQLLVFKN